MKTIIVLGAGMVGRTMAIDLTTKYQVTLADFNQTALTESKQKCNHLKTIQIDVTDKLTLQKTLKPFDLVICAVPGFLGFNTLKSIIEAKKNVVDISFFPENALELNNLAVDNQVTAIVDCGVAPGMGNIILGHYNNELTITDFECLVGGLPKIKKWPFNYKAPFSPIDVIEEYTRPARYVENGSVIVKEALSDVEHIDFKNVGTLEAFNSDGLRSLIFTMPHIKNMKEKTLRYPGHAAYIQVLKESGFLNSEKLNLNGTEIVPLEFTSKILFNNWFLKPEEEEFTVMRITIKGIANNKQQKKIVYHLHDEYCSKTNTSSMARTTGYTAAAVANLFLDGCFNKKGIFPPELIGQEKDALSYILGYLKDRNVIYIKQEF
ncbi:MAG: saccharopine dehydrogenase family protein [Lutibacter sp.]